GGGGGWERVASSAGVSHGQNNGHGRWPLSDAGLRRAETNSTPGAPRTPGFRKGELCELRSLHVDPSPRARLALGVRIAEELRELTVTTRSRGRRRPLAAPLPRRPSRGGYTHAWAPRVSQPSV